MLKKYMMITGILILMAGAVAADRYLFWPDDVTDPTIEPIGPAHTEHLVDTNTLTPQELKDCVDSDMSISIDILNSYDDHAVIVADAWDKCKVGSQTFKLTYPIHEYNNIIGGSAGILRTDKIHCIYTGEYARRVWGDLFIGGEVMAERKKIIGGTASVKFLF